MSIHCDAADCSETSATADLLIEFRNGVHICGACAMELGRIAAMSPEDRAAEIAAIKASQAPSQVTGKAKRQRSRPNTKSSKEPT